MQGLACKGIWGWLAAWWVGLWDTVEMRLRGLAGLRKERRRPHFFAAPSCLQDKARLWVSSLGRISDGGFIMINLATM